MAAISVPLTCLVLQKKGLQAIFTEIFDSSNNPCEKVILMAFGAIARVVMDCKSRDKHGVEFVKIARISTLLSWCKAQSRLMGLVSAVKVLRDWSKHVYVCESTIKVEAKSNSTENWKHASKVQLIQSFQTSRAWLFHLYFCQIPQHETLIIAIAIHHVRVTTKQPVHGNPEQNKWKQKRLALIKKKKWILLGWIQTIYRLHRLYNFCCKRGVAEIHGITATWNQHKNSIKCVMQNAQRMALLYRLTGCTSIWHQE